MRKHNFALLVILVIACGSLFLSLVVLYRWNVPLGPGLELPSFTPKGTEVSSNETPAYIPVVTSTQEAGSVLPATSQPAVATPSQPLCNGPATMILLGIGADQRSTSYLYGLADSIYVAYIDFRVPKIMIIDFPRDLWVEIPGISDHYGITHGKINQAYLFGNKGMGYYDGPGEGPGLLARTLDQNFGLRVDHYVAVNMQTFVKVVDTVGGVDIKLESPIDLNHFMNTPDPKIMFSVGTHHLDGETALLLATNRIPTTFSRMQYQRIILKALREKLLSPEMVPQIPGLLARFIGSIQTDLSLKDLNSLICIAQLVTEENIRADSIPEEMFTENATYDQYRNLVTFTYEADFDELRAVVDDFMNGNWPFPEK